MPTAEVYKAIEDMDAIIAKLYGASAAHPLEISSYEHYLALYFNELCYYIYGENYNTASWPMNYELMSVVTKHINDCALQAGVNTNYLLTPYKSTGAQVSKSSAFKTWAFGTVSYLNIELAQAATTRSANNPTSWSTFVDLLVDTSINVGFTIVDMILDRRIPSDDFRFRTPWLPLDTPYRVWKWGEDVRALTERMRDALAALQQYSADMEALMRDAFDLANRQGEADRDWYKAVFGPIISPKPSEREWLQWPVNAQTQAFVSNCMTAFTSCVRMTESTITDVVNTSMLAWMRQTLVGLVDPGLSAYYVMSETAKINAQRCKLALQRLGSLTVTTCWTAPRRNWYTNYVYQFLW